MTLRATGTSRHSSGFTLLEMIMVLAIASLIMTVGVSSLGLMADEHELRKVAQDAELKLMDTMTRAMTTTAPQVVNLEALAAGRKLTIRRAGQREYGSADGQRLLLRPGGLCEPLTLRWQEEGRWLTATLDPLTASFADMEDNL